MMNKWELGGSSVVTYDAGISWMKDYGSLSEQEEENMKISSPSQI